jgi:diguanylate cyclase (GGDEF)-like protein
MIDIDHFKQINDNFGHLAGDHVLKQLASAIKTRIRREDVFARYGGEEFAIILPEIDLAGAVTTAEKVRKVIEKQKFLFEDQQIPVTISLGVAAISNDVADMQSLLKNSDERLYEAKQKGRNRVCS